MSDELFGPEPWYSVRCLFHTHGIVRPGQDEPAEGEIAYEERITLWRARSFDQAVQRAEVEAIEYAAALKDSDRAVEYVGFAQAFHLFDEPGDGAEIFSLIRVSDLEPDEYVDRFFDTGEERQQQLPADD